MKYKKLLIIALIIISYATLCGVGVISHYHLEEPVFVESYASYELNERNGTNGYITFALDYITNAGDTRKVTNIYFPEAADMHFIYNVTQNQAGTSLTLTRSHASTSVQDLGHYSIHTIIVSILPPDFRSIQQTITLREAVVTYNYGETQKISIGCIELYPYGLVQDVFGHEYGSSTNNNSYESRGGVGKSMTLIGLETSHFSHIGEYLKCEFNGKNYNDISNLYLAYGSRFKIKTELNIPKDTVAWYCSYNIPLFVRYRDENGTECFSEIEFIHHTPYYDDFWSLVEYLKERGAL